MSVLKPLWRLGRDFPFNFPMALRRFHLRQTLITGNTVVFRGSSTTLYTGWKTAELSSPRPACPMVSSTTSAVRPYRGPGAGRTTPTSSAGPSPAPTMSACRWRAMRWPAAIRAGDYRDGRQEPDHRPRNADLDKAATGVARSAFGLDGQKCSACSRVYVEEKGLRPVRESAGGTDGGARVGNPTDRDTFMGTVIDRVRMRITRSSWKSPGATAR